MKRNAIVRLLRRMQEEYASLRSTPFSLQELFTSSQFQIGTYCQPFRPHPQTGQIVEAAHDFGQKYGIWLPQAQHYITCSTYLFPAASFDRMVAIVTNNGVDYYCNDRMGRDLFALLSPAEQRKAATIIERMATLNEDLQLTAHAAPIEWANAEMLRGIRDTSPRDWFSRFLAMYNHHIGVTHRDNNAASVLTMPTVEQYIEQRNHTSGMPHILLLVEYSQNVFLNWSWLQNADLASDMKRLHRATALFGCLSNDLFSFEKEVIDNTTDANLLAAIALNRPRLSLEEVIQEGAAVVREELSAYATTLKRVQERISGLAGQDPDHVEALRTHLEGIERCVQASWMWQAYTRRYKRVSSIWKETELAEQVVVTR